MEVYENINKILNQRNMTKRMFSDTLINLEPKLKSTGETPNEKTIYKYLNGNINIPIELISYIAEALDITEQELFETDTKTKLKLYKYISQHLDEKEFALINKLSNNSDLISDAKIKYGNNTESLSYHQKEIEKLISLLEFAPKQMVEKITKKLEQIKDITLSDI